MASEGGGKIKSKRGHASSKPYERRKSLFSRITDSIKDVLRPSWLSADTNQTPARDRPATSSVDEEEEEFVSPVQSPSELPGNSGLGLRTGQASQQAIHHADTSQYTSDSSAQWLQRPQLGQGPSTWENRGQTTRPTWGNSASTFDKTEFTRSFFAQRITGTKPVENTDVSSRGLGGVAPPATSTSSSSSHRRLHMSEGEMGSMAPSSQSQREHNEADSTLDTAGSSVLDSAIQENPSKRLRLWSPETLQKRQSQQPAAHRPAFKISVFSSPRLNESLHESSFYSGTTMYGGASAYRKASLNSSLPYQNSLPIRKSVKAKPLNNSGNAVLSSSATQILKTLERLSDAKRSRINETDTESLLSFTPASYRKHSRPLQTTLPSRSLELPVRGPPTNRLQSPVVASIAKNRQVVTLPAQRPPPASTITRRMEAERNDDDEDDESEGPIDTLHQQRTSLPSSSGFMVQSSGFRTPSSGLPAESPGFSAPSSRFAEPGPSRSGGKMKHQKSYDNRGRNRKPSREEVEVEEMPNLRTEFTLPINAMPTLNFGLPTSAESPLSTTSTAVPDNPMSKVISVGASVASNQSPPKLQFTFSFPIQKSGPGSTEPSPSPAADFQFSSPLKVSQSVSGDRQTSPATTGFSFAPPASSVYNAASAWGSTDAKPKSVTAGNSKMSPISGFGSFTSPMATTAASGSPLKPAPQLKSGSVMDILGKSPQGFSSSSGFKPAVELKEGSVMDNLGGISGGKVDSPSGSSGVKPAAELKKGSVMDILGGKSPSASGTDSLFSKFAPPVGSWDCETCMVQNKAEATKCVACNAQKPGDKQKAASVPSLSKAPVASSDSLFSKFVAPAGSWECEVCMVQNKAEHTKCVACSTRKPDAGGGGGGGSVSSSSKSPAVSSDSLFSKFVVPAGSWECEVCMIQNKAEHTKCVACSARKPGSAAAASPSKTSNTNSGDSLFAKFAAPAGTWDCEACMLQNKPEATKCVACETPKRGAASSSKAVSSDSLMAKFKRPAGDWDCDVCLVQNTGGHSKCVACQSPRPGAMSTGTSPPPAPAAKVGSSGGLVFNLPTTTSGPSPFLAAISTAAQSSTSTGFKFGSSTSSGGFKLGSSGVKDTPASGGFKFGQQDISNSNSASSSTLPATGFQFGGKDISTESVKTTTSDPKTVSSSSGFQFGAPTASAGASAGGGGFVFGGKAASALASTTTTTTTTSVSASGFNLASSTGMGGFQFGVASQSPSQTVDSESVGSKLTTGDSVSKGRGGSQPGFSFSPVFGAGKPSNNFALGAAPSLVTGSVNSSLTTGGIQFQGLAGSKDSTSSMFAAGIITPSVPISQSTQKEGGSSRDKPLSVASSFSFSATAKSSIDAATKPGLFTSAEGDSTKKNGIGISAPSSSTSQGFAFGASSSGSGLPTNLFSSVPQLSSAGFITTPASKPPVNGEVGAPSVFAFGQQSSAPGAATTGGFSFEGAGSVGKDSSSAQNLVTQTKPFPFGADTSVTSKPSEKRRLDNDIGPTDAKKHLGVTGQSVGGGEGFKFVNPTASTGASLFKFGQPSEGFNFSGATQPSFNFGTNNTNTSGPVFQFGSTPSAEPAAPAQPAASGIFVFGQPAPSVDSSVPPSAFTAPNPVGFGAAPAQNNFNIGTGESRKIKRAVRRTARK